MIRGRLSDAEWAFLEPFVIETGPKRCRPPSGHRRVLDGIFWIARTGSPWRDLPEEFGKWGSAYRQFLRWTRGGLWDILLDALAGAAARRPTRSRWSTRPSSGRTTAQPAERGIQKNALGRSRGGFSTKIHLRTNAEGLPIGTALTPGEAHDLNGYGALMDESAPDPKVLLADRGYDADAVRADVGECQRFCVRGFRDRLVSSRSSRRAWKAITELDSKLPHRGRPFNPSAPA